MHPNMQQTIIVLPLNQSKWENHSKEKRKEGGGGGGGGSVSKLNIPLTIYVKE